MLAWFGTKSGLLQACFSTQFVPYVVGHCWKHLGCPGASRHSSTNWELPLALDFRNSSIMVPGMNGGRGNSIGNISDSVPGCLATFCSLSHAPRNGETVGTSSWTVWSSSCASLYFYLCTYTSFIDSLAVKRRMPWVLPWPRPEPDMIVLLVVGEDQGVGFESDLGLMRPFGFSFLP